MLHFSQLKSFIVRIIGYSISRCCTSLNSNHSSYVSLVIQLPDAALLSTQIIHRTYHWSFNFQMLHFSQLKSFIVRIIGHSISRCCTSLNSNHSSYVSLAIQFPDAALLSTQIIHRTYHWPFNFQMLISRCCTSLNSNHSSYVSLVIQFPTPLQHLYNTYII